MNYEAIRLVIEGPLARLNLARPDRGNEVDLRFLREIDDAAEAVSDAEDVRVLLVAARGKDFCRGWAAEIPDPATLGVDPFASIARLAIPVIAALQGEVAGAGLDLALVCDIRLAAEDARFRVVGAERGSIPFGGSTQRLPRIARRGPAM